MTKNDKSLNRRFREYWNEKYPDNPCWVDETEPEREYRPWKEKYEESGSDLPFTKWKKQENVHDYRLDFVLVKYSLAVEFDGREHSRGTNVEKDRRKSNELQLMGYLVLRFSADTLLSSFRYVEDEILKALKVTTWI